jgi:cell division transport system permease protein
MFWTNIKRILRSGFMNFWRNGTVSLASVFMMVVMLLVIGFIVFGTAILNTSLDELRNKVDITVTFVPTAVEKDILDIKHSLETMPEVSLVTYTSRDDALSAFEARHQNDQAILTALNQLPDNPLGAELDVKAKDPSQYQGIADFLQGRNALSSGGLTIIDHVNYFQNKIAIDKLTTIIHAADRLGFGIALAFIFLSILIAFNTIRLTIYISRDEIGVMRLVGASKAYIQGPFVVVGIMYGVVAAILTLVIFLPVTYWIGKVTTDFFIGLNLFTYYLHHFAEIFGILVGAGFIAGAIASFWASRRYLKM